MVPSDEKLRHLRKLSENCRVRIDRSRSKQWSSQDFHSGRFCYVFSWIGRESYSHSDLYCQHDCPLLAIFEKWTLLANRREIVCNQGNARPHTSTVAREKLWKIGCDVPIYPPYSPGLDQVITICSCLWRIIQLVKNSPCENEQIYHSIIVMYIFFISSEIGDINKDKTFRLLKKILNFDLTIFDKSRSKVKSNSMFGT